MKVTKTQASENREAILDAAAAQIRARGLDQISVAEVARAAGLTHGALYSHFDSKETLKAAAARRAFDDTLSAFEGVPLDDFIGRYLSPQHRDNPDKGCPNAALVSEVWRQSASTQSIFKDGVKGFVDLAEDTLRTSDSVGGRDRAITMFAAMVGGMALSRAVRDVDKAGSDDILRAVATQLRLISGARQAEPEA